MVTKLSVNKPESRFINSQRKWPTRQLNKKLKACQLWENMRQRVEDVEFHKQQPTYENVGICDEWLDYQNFADWFDGQVKSGVYKDGWHLDKDILSPKGRKIYSPATCTFLPKDLNNILISKQASRGECARGVNRHRDKFAARISRGDKGTLQKRFDTELEAFQYYKQHKELYVKSLVSEYKDMLPQEVVDFFNNYEVNFDD